jgi:hypothetical protein
MPQIAPSVSSIVSRISASIVNCKVAFFSRYNRTRYHPIIGHTENRAAQCHTQYRCQTAH